MIIRPAEAERDVPILQALYGSLLEEEPTPAYVRRVIREAAVQVAEPTPGAVTGFRVLSRRETMPPEQAFVWVTVHEAHRRQGTGQQLMEDALREAARRGFIELISRVDDSNAAGIAFCERFGFQRQRHMIRLVLHRRQWQPSVLTPYWKRLTAEGVQFATFAALGDYAHNRQRLYRLNKTLSASIPIDEPEDFPAFEPYVARRLSGEAFPHDGIFLALVGDEWAGMTQISVHNTHAFVEMTGVLPEYRGRGIAQALKLLSIRFAWENDYDVVQTVNDMGNQPMIAVNQKAGFRKDNGFYFMRLLHRPS